MHTQEPPTITKETQKTILKAVCENPTFGFEELTLFLKSIGKNISQDEVVQVIQSIAPNKNWHRATKEDVQKEILEYLWTLEAQILFLLPTKQKETTVAEFNQFRLQNKQVKVQKDLIRHLLSLLSVDGKNLVKFRKFEKELSYQNDLDPNTQANWTIRIILSSLNPEHLQNYQELSTLIVNQFKEKYPVLAEKVGKTIQRLSERFTEKYFPKNVSETKLRELITTYQSILNTYKSGSDKELSTQTEFYDQNKLVQSIIEKLQDAQEIVNESHEGGFLSKLLTGRVKNKEGVIKKIDEVIKSLNQVLGLNFQTNKTINEKVLLVQKLQSDYENIVLVKSQLENDTFNLNEKLNHLEEENNNLKKEFKEKTESLQKAQEKIASLQHTADTIPEHESKENHLREDLSTAKSIAISLYQRVNKLKADLLNRSNDKPKNNHKTNYEQKFNNGNQTIHKLQQNQETGQTTLTTEITTNN